MREQFETTNTAADHLEAIRMFVKDWELHCTRIPFNEHIEIRNYIFNAFENAINQVVKIALLDPPDGKT